MKAARLLASEITQTGAKVHDLLANEASERCIHIIFPCPATIHLLFIR